MKDPHNQITCLRDRLINRLIDLDAKLRDLKSFYVMVKDHENLSAINKCPYFFRLHVNGILNDFLITISKTFDANSRRSIYKLLDWIKSNEKNIKYKPESDPVKFEDIENFLNKIDGINDTLVKIKMHRDKFIAHDDVRYFDQPFIIHDEAPLPLLELENVLTVLRSILFRIYSSIECIHYDMRIANLRN